MVLGDKGGEAGRIADGISRISILEFTCSLLLTDLTALKMALQNLLYGGTFYSTSCLKEACCLVTHTTCCLQQPLTHSAHFTMS